MDCILPVARAPMLFRVILFIVYPVTGATAGAANVIGLYFTAGTGSNTVFDNFIHGLSAVSSITATVYGIKNSRRRHYLL